jgi:quinolinate synthase
MSTVTKSMTSFTDDVSPGGQAPLLEAYRGLTEAEITDRTWAARRSLGSALVLLGHHYQRDEVIRYADFTGDSFKLARLAAEQADARWVVFCGVHFMAESADVLTGPEVSVILPDLGAGCSMADMANLLQVEQCWKELTDIAGDDVVPVTYMNSAADLKAFCGRHGGAVCTSSNCRQVFEWALEKGSRVLFFPDEHLGRNTAWQMGLDLDALTVWDPAARRGGETPERYRRSPVVLWKGFCSVHQKFLPQHVDEERRLHPGTKVVVHPECRHEVARKADAVGSTEFIIRVVRESDPGTRWAVGTEAHLVARLGTEHTDKTVVSLNPYACACSTMYRISPERLLWSLEELVAGRVVNRIQVPDDVAQGARLALDRMLEIA